MFMMSNCNSFKKNRELRPTNSSMEENTANTRQLEMESDDNTEMFEMDVSEVREEGDVEDCGISTDQINPINEGDVSHHITVGQKTNPPCKKKKKPSIEEAIVKFIDSQNQKQVADHVPTKVPNEDELFFFFFDSVCVTADTTTEDKISH